MSDLSSGKKEAWTSRLGVIMAVTGSAVGLGNFLRFPGKAVQYEGGAFMVPYFVALLLLGLPIAWSEWAMGRYGGTRGFNSVPGVLRAVWRKNPLAPYIGALGLLVPVGIYMYYVYIEAWCLSYAVGYLTGDLNLGRDAGPYLAHFKDVTGTMANGDAFTFKGGFFQSGVFFLILCFVLNFVLIYRGLSKGIEWFCNIAMPALIVCALLVLLRVLTLGTPDASKPEQNVVNGLGYMWNPTVQADWIAPSDKPLAKLMTEWSKGPGEGLPLVSAEAVAHGKWNVGQVAAFVPVAAANGWSVEDGVYRHDKSRIRFTVDAGGTVSVLPQSFWRSLMNAQMWLEAAGQIFFSLSVGFGVILCYASYLKKNDDIALSSVTASAGNEFCEVALGGLITIPAAFVFLGAAGAGAAASSSFDLGFVTLPQVFATMPLGSAVGFLFFFLLFLAAITSSLSMLQGAIALFEEGLALDRKASVTMLMVLTAIGSGFVVFFSRDLIALDTIDFWVGSFGIYVLASIQVVVFGWVMGVDKGHEELNRAGHIRIPRAVMYIVKYVSPAYLLIVFVAWCYQGAGQYVDVLVGSADADEKAREATMVARLAVAFIVLLLIFFLLVISRAVKRWQRMELPGNLGGGSGAGQLSNSTETRP
jgi:SNF family Na+-dependent transporter